MSKGVRDMTMKLVIALLILVCAFAWQAFYKHRHKL
jgi:hypothetical protein